ncbi:methyltransf_25 domain-containing protein, partial [Haematococcus lacustris]
ERGDTLALDVGCAVGGASMELARAFTDVLGIDYSHAFVAAAQGMARDGARQYEAVLEGELRLTYTATVPTDIDRTRVRFMQGDACDLPKSLPQFDAVLAANLLCRLPDPIKFIHRLPSLVKPGGVAVLVSPYSWLAAWTPKSNWLGGQLDKAGDWPAAAT